MALEDDLIETSRYVAICEENFTTYSTQFTHLLLAAGSEIDVVAKQLCKQIDPTRMHRNINEYRSVIVPRFPAIPTMELGIQWNPVRVKPWEFWGAPTPSNPDWWRAYNEVKHERNINFRNATLRNALSAIAGLHCLVRHLDEDKGQPKQSRFLRIVS
jgi:hypothetical protein